MSEPQPDPYDPADELVDIWQEQRAFGPDLPPPPAPTYTRNMSESEHRPTPTGRTQ